MDRELAAPQQGKDPVKPASSSGNLQRNARAHAQGPYSTNVCEEKLFKLFVVGQIQENSNARSCDLRAWTSCAARCWISSFASSGHERLLASLRSCCRMSYRNINANSSSWPDFSPPCRSTAWHGVSTTHTSGRFLPASLGDQSG